MSSIHAHAGFRPNRPSPFLKRLALMLMRDQQRRPAPVSLPGRPTSAEPLPKPKPPPAARAAYAHFNYVHDRNVCREEAEPSDAIGPYSRSQLLRMNWRFTQRVERAFRAGTETREAANATLNSATERSRPPQPID